MKKMILPILFFLSLLPLSACQASTKKGKEAMKECATRISSYFDERFPFHLSDYISPADLTEKGWSSGGSPAPSAPLQDTRIYPETYFFPDNIEADRQKCREEGKFFLISISVDHEQYSAPVSFHFNGWTVEQHPSWPEVRQWFKNEFKDFDLQETENKQGPVTAFDAEKNAPLSVFIPFFEYNPPTKEEIAKGAPGAYYRYYGLDVIFTEKTMLFSFLFSELIQL